MKHDRPELSKKNKYWISRHRFYELKHFCLQYNDMKELYSELMGNALPKQMTLDGVFYDRNATSDVVCDTAIALERISGYMDAIRTAANEADSELANYIFVAVTEERPCDYLITKLGMPCSKDTFYDRIRKFYYILHRKLWFAE